jgi:ketosteroid isomerase-like protein
MKIIAILFLANSIPGFLKAQEKQATDAHAVHQTVINLFDALSNRDTVMLKANCTADILLFEDGKVWNIDTMMSAIITLKKLNVYTRINKIEFIHTEIHNDVAWTTYHNQADINVNGKNRSVKWVETVILMRDGKKWKIKILHSTPDKGV